MSAAALAPFPTELRVGVPDWLRDAQAAAPEHLGTRAERFALVNALAERNVEEGTGGPFAAAVVDEDTGAVVALGVNLVLHTNLSSMHAEVVTLGLAQARTGAWNLGRDVGHGRVLVVNAQPCVMCLGALLWSGVSALEFAADGATVERITGFDEGPVPGDWREQLVARGIDVHQEHGTGAETALERYRDLVESGATARYNGSGA
ncbi:cytidine/deoxycytidylate deaminase-like protein [Curtobacterium sp. PhB172]|uniref:deaminase n=1 Tax=Curtobacterium sp. PhB172 TaxID=2485196 RepID=UPI000F4B082C|nr:nucleoside deaminase [Curtobacterium sp. PhB172]ROS67125.1 cytidine/deoxycytidylate deaminase-like protein [Curtobacterium sp. PhB172]